MNEPVFDSLATITDLTTEVRALLPGHGITVEYPGIIAVQVGKYSLWFGNVNPVIDADVNELCDGELKPAGGVVTTFVESSCPDVKTIAHGIAAAVTRFKK